MNFDLKDIAGLGKPLEKLLDVFARGGGNLFSLLASRRQTENEVYRIEEISRAIKKSKAELGENASVDWRDGNLVIISPSNPQMESLTDRAHARITYQEALQQENIEKITLKAAEQLYLEEGENVSDEPVDQDWINRFYEDAKFISNEEMQMLWGRILAGEIKTPGSYSLRTLNTLKYMTSDDAIAFEKVVNYALKYFTLVFIWRNTELLDSEFGISIDNILHLAEAGLLQYDNNLKLTLDTLPDQICRHAFEYGDKYTFYAEYSMVQQHAVRIPIIQFTRAGRELLNLLQPQFQLHYLQKFASSISREDSLIGYGTGKLNQNRQVRLDDFTTLEATGIYSDSSA